MKKRVAIYTVGACSGNPSPGGWAAILVCGQTEKEISGKDHVAAAIDHEDDLRVLGVSRDLVAVSAAGAALDVIPAGVRDSSPVPSTAAGGTRRWRTPSRSARSSTASKILRAGVARSSRWAAFWKVVKCGTVFIPIWLTRSAWSTRCSAKPR